MVRSRLNVSPGGVAFRRDRPDRRLFDHPAIDTAIPPPPGPATKYSALVVDAASSETLYQDNATAVRYPASLTKMMTLYLTFEALDQGRISKSTLIPVSRFAARQAPSRIGLKAGQTIDVDSAILALTVKSGNDAAVALAEYPGGSEEGFAADDDGQGAAARHDAARHSGTRPACPTRSSARRRATWRFSEWRCARGFRITTIISRERDFTYQRPAGARAQ